MDSGDKKSSSSVLVTKIFVGGISWDTTDSGFTSFFSKFGEIKDAQIMRDKSTGGSRGFGFVKFADPSSVDKVLSQELELDGRKIDCKIAVPRGEIGTGPGQHRTRKLFIGGLSPLTTQEQFKEHFSQFGNLVNAVIMIDHQTNRSRGFGFVTYDSEDAVDAVLARTHTINGKVVECKKAIPKQQIDVRGQGLYGPSFDAYGYPAGYGYGYHEYPPREYFYGAPMFGRGFAPMGRGFPVGRGGGRGGGRGYAFDFGGRGRDRQQFHPYRT